MPIREISPIEFDATSVDATTQNSLEYFIYYVSPNIDVLNQWIEAYNNEGDASKKPALLEGIKTTYESIDGAYPDTLVSQCPDYIKKMHEDLFVDIQRESRAILPSQPSLISPAVDVLANLPPIQANRMAKIISSGKAADLSQLRSIYTEEGPEKQAFNAFLDACEIEFLGGSNSKNFTLFHKPSGKAFDLKLENRMGMPRSLERELRASDMGDVFVPIYADRQVTYEDEEGLMVTRGLQLTELCDAGNLVEDTSRCSSVQERLSRAPHVYGQVLQFLKRTQANGAFYRDLKNGNVLDDKDDKVWLADTKSFMHVDEEGLVTRGNIKNMYYRSPATRSVDPPECYASQAFSAEKAHVQMLGKNLYQYITGLHHWCFVYPEAGVPEQDWNVRHDASELEYPSQVFGTEDGMLLEELIRGMVRQEPGDRITLDEVENKLDLLESRQLLRELQTYTVDASALEKIERVAAVLKNPEKHMDNMSRIKTRLTSMSQAVEKALDDKREACSDDLAEVMKYRIQRRNKRPFQDVKLNSFEKEIKSKIKHAITEKNLVKLTDLHQHVTTVKATFRLLKELKQGEKESLALRSILNSPAQVQAMHDALEAVRDIMQQARDGLEPEAFEALLEQTDIKRTMLDVPIETRAAFVKKTFKAALRAQASSSQDFKAEFQEVREALKNPDEGVDNAQDQGLEDSPSNKKPQ